METLKFYNRKKSLPVFVTISSFFVTISSLVKSANSLLAAPEYSSIFHRIAADGISPEPPCQAMCASSPSPRLW